MNWQALVAGTEDFVRALLVFLFAVVAIVVGASLIFSGVKKMIAHSRGERQGQPTAGPVLINFAIGALLIQFSISAEIVVHTLFGTAAEPPSKALSYMPQKEGSSPLLTQALTAALMWVHAIGFIAVFRGILLWNELSKGGHVQGSPGWRGFWHVFFGGLAINISGVIGLFN